MVLSNHFVRYAVLPERDGAASSEEELALARFHLTKIHGERVKGWEVRVSERLARCAIDAALLEGIKACFSRTQKPRLVSVQPRLMAAYNAARGRIPREGAWLLLAEPGRTCLARIAAKGWASVHNGREADVDELLERERSRARRRALPALVLKHERASRSSSISWFRAAAAAGRLGRAFDIARARGLGVAEYQSAGSGCTSSTPPRRCSAARGRRARSRASASTPR